MSAHYCPNFRAVLVAEYDDQTRLVTRTRCKQWSCEYCAVVNMLSHRARIINRVNAEPAERWSFHTFTAHRRWRGPHLSLANLRQGWDRFMKRAKRRFGKFDYVRIYEPHLDESWHVHALWSVTPDDIVKPDLDKPSTWYSRWIKDTCAEVGVGFMTNSQPVRGHAGYVAGYATKYMTKHLMTARSAEIGRLRRIQYSQGWTAFDPQPDFEWVMKSGIYADDVVNYHHIDIQTGEVVTLDNFSDTFIYPPEFDTHGHDENCTGF